MPSMVDPSHPEPADEGPGITRCERLFEVSAGADHEGLAPSVTEFLAQPKREIPVAELPHTVGSDGDVTREQPR
jgi:hypothetical protein